MKNWAGKKAIVTGGSSGIGRAVVDRLVAQGVTTAIVSRNPEPRPPLGRAYSLDLTQVPTVKTTIASIVAELGGIDFLINCAGMAYIAPLAEMPLEAWQKLFDLNVTSVFQVLQGVLPTMRQQNSGTILNVASIAGKQGFPDWSAYCASKFALVGMGQALAEEEKKHGIRVMTICPGSVNTPLWDTLGDMPAHFDRSAMLTPDTVADTIVQMLSLQGDGIITELVLMPNAGIF
jgi:NAD(P)-dependent dehydrogenase (short-subunit alcohol dehydrogenase family)